MDDKIWYILINEKKEGPYTFLELKYDHRITPDTLAWREGFLNWLPIGKIPELKDLFKDESPPTEDEEQKDNVIFKKPLAEQEVIAIRKDPPFNIWVFVAIFIIIYLLYLLLK